MVSLPDKSWFSDVSRPSRYLGGEINAIEKDPSSTEVSIALAFPDTYEVGMSHVGLKILYHVLNKHHWMSAERAFAPWPDLEQHIRTHKIALTTLESNRPLSSFDIVGFSLQHELCYTNVLNMLDLSGITLLSSERGDSQPLIIAGGPVCFNPEPMAEVFDVMLIGDGEKALPEICETVRRAKRNQPVSKKDILHELRSIRGVYIPSFFHMHYKDEGPISRVEPLLKDYQFVEKAIIPDLDESPYPERQVVPFTELIHDRLAVEICRGCTRGCRFCQAGMIYRPVRERSPSVVLEKAEKALRLTGYDDLSLLSLSSGDYSCILELVKVLMDKQTHLKTAISLPSLRVESLDSSLMEQIKRVRKTGFTLAPEAGSDRLRRIINKGLTEDDILQTAQSVYDAGWNLIKLYFMIGLPFEHDNDLEGIVNLVKRIARLPAGKGKKPKLNVSISTFVPKAHTPFMWVSQISLEESLRRIQWIQKELRKSPVRVRWNDAESSWLEGILSRGDRRLTPAIIEAWNLGAKFDSWGEHFKKGIWEEAFRRKGVDDHFYLGRERPLDEVLPWDHIRSGIAKGFFIREWERAQRSELTPDCRQTCLECGVCDHKMVDPVIYDDCGSLKTTGPVSSNGTDDLTHRYRITFTKLGHAGYLSHLELVRVFVRAFRRAGLLLKHSKGFHPMPKLSFGSALPVGVESMEEIVDIETNTSYSTTLLKRDLNDQLPEGIAVKSVERLSTQEKKKRLTETHYRITCNNAMLEEEDLERFLRSDCFSIAKRNKKGEHQINARPMVASMKFAATDRIDLVIQKTSGPQLRPDEIVKAIFCLEESKSKKMKILKTAQIFS
ncbi:MAG: TIGR03960 family B12-binding radical SAM protein [Desulfatiglans sp.]|jgi:radical SAM family uncharacterized protein/radical SAM-linked protein|nr:TIGR03960 family B12-binding radical SAM protein [Thermodesulfobacteriota bacterium]MEE4354577.1 TIGR03960 family B12-binding radical SAM protein [Desulfatiglans sp.]